jgi:hypothetical protein
VYKRGDDYNRQSFQSWSKPELLEVQQARKRAGWDTFHRHCGEIEVFFDDYQRRRGRFTVQVFTVVGVLGCPRGPRRRRNLWLAEGSGHDPVSASIDAYRKSGGSSLSAWLAALTMQIAKLEELIHGRAEGASRNHSGDTVA